MSNLYIEIMTAFMEITEKEGDDALYDIVQRYLEAFEERGGDEDGK